MGRNKKSEERSQESGAWLCFLLFAFCFLLLNCSNKKDSSPKFTQYYNQGETLYQKNCSNCHQKNGSGLGLVYPPLDSSDYMEKNFKDVICLIRNGKKGELIVNGKKFNQPMPAIPTLTDLEIAEIATYIYNTWSHQKGLVEVKEVSELLKACPD
jgi:cytochrome c551